MSAIIVIACGWEDAALSSAALLGVDHRLGSPAAGFAVLMGICSGGLYYLGRYSHRWCRLQALILARLSNRQLGRRFGRSTITNVMLIRIGLK